MVYFKNICLILIVIFLKICNSSSGHIFNLYLILAVIFSKILKPNVAKMLREREKKKKKKNPKC
jgi:hypothetical protein